MDIKDVIMDLFGQLKKFTQVHQRPEVKLAAELNADEELEYIQGAHTFPGNTVFVREIKGFVWRHLNQPLTNKEFDDIEAGFRLRWNFSVGQLVSDEEFQRAVAQYLAEIESPIYPEKVYKVVALILQYMEDAEEYDNF